MTKIVAGCFWLLAILLYAGCSSAQLPAPAVSIPAVNIYDTWAEYPGYDGDEKYYKSWTSSEGLEEPAWSYKIPDVLPHFTVPLVRCTDAEAATDACSEKQRIAHCDRFWTWLMAQPDTTPPESRTNRLDMFGGSTW